MSGKNKNFKYIFSFFVKVFKSKHASNNSGAWQPFPVIFMFEIFLLHNYLYIVLFTVTNRFANAIVGHGICIWAWTIRKLAYPLSFLPLPH